MVYENRVFKFDTNDHDPCLDTASTCRYPTDGQSDDDHRLGCVRQMEWDARRSNSSCVDTLCNDVFNPDAKVRETRSKGILSWKLRGQGWEDDRETATTK
jgi:hypothetical protein